MGILKQEKEELDTLLNLEKTKSSDLQKKLDEVTLHFQRRIAGQASANAKLSRKLSADSPLDSPAPVCSHDSHGLGFVVVSREFDDRRIFEGIKYFGSQSGKVRKTTGKPLIFVKFPSDTGNSTVSERVLNERVPFSTELCCQFSLAPNLPWH